MCSSALCLALRSVDTEICKRWSFWIGHHHFDDTFPPKKKHHSETRKQNRWNVASISPPPICGDFFGVNFSKVQQGRVILSTIRDSFIFETFQWNLRKRWPWRRSSWRVVGIVPWPFSWLIDGGDPNHLSCQYAKNESLRSSGWTCNIHGK